MNRIYTLIIFIVFFIWFIACDKDDGVDYISPKEYLPAYPGSFWDYTNGERVLVDLNYQPHQYEEGINSTQWTDVKMVPVVDGRYLYEYSIYQNSTSYPLKQLLQENKNDWIVNRINNQDIKREVISSSDTLLIHFADSATYDSLKNVIVVVEYMDSLGKDRWNEKEFYAKNIGLVRKEVNNPYDSLDAVVVKQIHRYFINH